MWRKVHALTAKSVANARTPGYHADGMGLYLQVRQPDPKARPDYFTRSWLFRFRLNGRVREMGLGSADRIALAEARRLAHDCHLMLAQKIDPIIARDERARVERASERKVITFAKAAEQYVEDHRAEWRSAKHADQWSNTLRDYAVTKFGTKPIDTIDTDDVLDAVRPIWTTKTETAKRLRGRIEQVIDWATVHKYRAGDNPARWRGHLDKLLPKPGKVAKVEHQPALPYTEIGRFMQALRAAAGTGARAVEFTILTAALSGEVRGATWGEIDLKSRVWTVPRGRMKGDREHRVPLSDAAIRLLESMPGGSGADPVFLAPRAGKLSDMAFTAVLRRLNEADTTSGGPGFVDPKQNGKPATMHGFRSTFRDWAGAMTPHPDDVVERARAHKRRNKPEAAEASVERG